MWCVRRGPPVRGSSSKVEVPSSSRRSVASRQRPLQEQGEPRSGQEPLGLSRLEMCSAPASVGVGVHSRVHSCGDGGGCSRGPAGVLSSPWAYLGRQPWHNNTREHAFTSRLGEITGRRPATLMHLHKNLNDGNTIIGHFDISRCAHIASMQLV